MKMIFLPTSSNKKTGDIMQSYSSRSTCPKSCVFKNNGCYAEGCHTRMVWDRCEDKRFISCPVTLIHPQGNDFMKSMLEFSDQDDLANLRDEHLHKNFKPKDQRSPTMINMILLPESQNSKTGNILQSYSSPSSCPVSCPFKESGCYAKSIRTSKVWERADNREDKRFIGCQDDLANALTGALWLDKGDRDEVLFRHNIAGDMAVVGTDKFDIATYLSMVSAIMTANYRLKVAGSSKHIKAFTYTHCWDYSVNDRDCMRLLKDYMLVNISCETVDEAVITKGRGLNAVLTSIYPEADIAALKAKGIPAVQCPAQTKGITCKECRLCSRDREAVVLFEVHGQSKGKARRVIQIKRAQH